jgi:hypothetical protein
MINSARKRRFNWAVGPRAGQAIRNSPFRQITDAIRYCAPALKFAEVEVEFAVYAKEHVNGQRSAREFVRPSPASHGSLIWLVVWECSNLLNAL